ncbi:MAG: hypothetical protein CUN55_14115 [Phototrophicales bacterium]|nr:MAG: hypothetical protein CUN55_14115 [Phototrophicales bacterium]
MIIELRKTYKFRLYEDGVRRVSHATVVDGKNPLPLGRGSMSNPPFNMITLIINQLATIGKANQI